jgi:hypothetical protein
MKKHLIVSFQTLNQADLLAKANHIVGALRDNPHFPPPWPAPVLPLDQLETLVAEYGKAYQAALNGDRVKIAERKAISDNLIEQLKKVAHYLEMVADGDEAILIGTGYDLSHEPVHGKAKTDAGGPGPA